MLQEITTAELLKTDNLMIVDARSEKEYMEGTIPGSVNVPLFNDQERAEIGTIYTQVSPKKAMALGLKFASRKLPELHRTIETMAEGRKIALFCSRGGMRSKSIATILDLMGLPILRLTGGYKAYRKYILEFFEGEFPFHVVLVRGNTGVGKTKILKQLKVDGYPVIDLEDLSNNRGSVFGHIGLGNQPSQKQFEGMLFREIQLHQKWTYLLIECESKRIGRVSLPNSLYTAMQEGTQVLIYDTLQRRATRLVEEYIEIPKESLEEVSNSLFKLKKRLGNSLLEELSENLKLQQYEAFAKIMIVNYYDQLYGYPNDLDEKYELSIFNEPEESAYTQLKDFLDKRFLLKR